RRLVTDRNPPAHGGQRDRARDRSRGPLVTTPGAGGGPSPLRLGGLGLIGVAVVAAIIGLASMATNGDPTATVSPSADASNVTSEPAAAPPAEPPPTEQLPTELLPTDAAALPTFAEPVPGEPVPGEPVPGAVPP